MTRQLEQRSEDKSRRRAVRVTRVLDNGLVMAVDRAGGQLTGYTIRGGEFDTLLILRAIFPGGPMVGFIGASGPVEALLKAEREASRDGVKWRADRYAK